MPVEDNRLEEKLSAYMDFWNRKRAVRPLVGVDVGGWFPFQRFSSLSGIPDGGNISSSMLDPDECLNDYEDFFSRSLETEDDLIKGVCPISAIPWMEAILGANLRRNRDSVWADERGLSWEDIDRLKVEKSNIWLTTYLSFVRELSIQAGGRFPVGLPILRGVTDLFGMLRGHTESLMDCMAEPELSRKACELCADALIRVVGLHHEAAGDFHGGYYIEQYNMWAPGPLVRMQEDSTAVYSPDLYRDIVLAYDSKIADAYPYSMMHIHSASLFLLESFLEIKNLDIFQINKDICEMDLPQMMPYLKRIQDAGRLLYIRGPLTADDFRLAAKELSPDGLVLQTVVQKPEEAEDVRSLIRTLY